MTQGDERQVDAVILTAIQLEYDEVLNVDAGAVGGARWEDTHSESGLPIAFRRFTGKGDRPLRVAVALAPDMGATAGIAALSPLVEWLQPRCIAMCGVCAGRADKGVQLGDVIAADRVFYHDTGKQRADGVEQDLNVYKLRDDWKLALGRMDPVAQFGGETWFQDRPLTTEWREQRALVALRDRVAEPWKVVDPAMHEPAWQRMVASLRERKLLAASGRELTEDGLRFVDDLLFAQMGQLPDVSPAGARYPLRLHVAPIGSGTRVIEDEKIWREVSQAMRKTLGIEMEAAMIGELAHRLRHRELDWLVMKGVMDFAEPGRDDHFKEFAARASAECLLWFLREHLATDPVAGFDDVLETRILPLPARDASPAMLLAAPFAVVRWHRAGRADLLAELDAWADDPLQPVAVRLLHAEGGVGKTRLAIEWLHARRRQGDTAGFLPLAAKHDWLARTRGLGAPVVVAVDYAETRADLIAVLGRVAAMAAVPKPGRRIRMLLLARSDGDWWQALLQGELSLKALLTAQPPIELAPLAATPAERHAVFNEALAAFAEYRKQSVPPAQLVADSPQVDRVLYLHMAALAAVERSANPSATASYAASPVLLDARLLMDEILDHEQRFWQRDRQQRRPATISLAQQLVAAATLRGGISREGEAQALCKRLSGRERTDADDELLALLHDVYAAEAPRQYLSGLQPDLLGEAMVLRVATQQADAAWIERVIVASDDSEAITSAFTVLARASETAPDTVTPWLATLLQTELAARAVPALRAAKAVGQRTAFSPLGDLLADALERGGTADLALAVADEPIPYPTVSLPRAAEWSSRVRLAHARSGNDQPAVAERAARRADWGLRLGALGKREAALAATRDAVEAYRALAAQSPDAFLPRFARSLTNLGKTLSEVGQREAALDATLEATELYRALTAQNPDTFFSDLAASLNNLGALLSEVGQREASLDTIRQTVEAYRALAAQNPNMFLAALAGSLHNMGKMLSEVGQREAALDATREAVEVRRALASQNPDAFLPDLAMSLNNLGADLSEVGEHEAALDSAREAVEAYRSLAAKNPEAFLPYLARSMNNLGNQLSEVGQQKAALDSAREAVEAYRSLAAKHPDTFLRDFAMSLNNLGIRLSEVGQRETALDATREAVELRRALAAKHADVFLSDLAASLNNLGVQLRAAGQQEAALDATRDAVAAYRALAAKHSDAFLPDLAGSLHNLSTHLSALGRHETALNATREAVELRRALATKRPDAFRPYLAISLDQLARRLTNTGDHDAANAASCEAAEIRRTLQAKNTRRDDEGGSA